MSQLSTIGVIAPASACPEEDREHYQNGINFLQELGLKTILAENIFDSDDAYADAQVGTAGSVRARVDELHKIWSRDDVDAIIAIRGGYGCIQLLEHIDYELLASKPKPFMGYSDITALHLALFQRSNLATYHTPMLSEVHKWHPMTKDSFINLLNLLGSVEGNSNHGSSSEASTVNIALGAGVSGEAGSPKVLGGNLSVICSLIGTEYLPSFRDSVMLLEECNEPKYKVDRMLYQMKYAGLFEGIKGLWLGQPFKADFPKATLEMISQEFDFQIVEDLPVGHGEINLSVPLG